jgi:hypothetical protein
VAAQTYLLTYIYIYISMYISISFHINTGFMISQTVSRGFLLSLEECFQFFMSLSLITQQCPSFMASRYISLSFMFWLLFNRTTLISRTLIYLVPGISSKRYCEHLRIDFYTFLLSLQYTHSFSSLGLFETKIVD